MDNHMNFNPNVPNINNLMSETRKFYKKIRSSMLLLGLVIALTTVITAFSIPIAQNLHENDHLITFNEGDEIMEAIRIKRPEPKKKIVKKLPESEHQFKLTKEEFEKRKQDFETLDLSDDIKTIESDSTHIPAGLSLLGSSNKVVDHPQVSAEFPGGEAELLKYIKNNFRYLDKESEGTIYASFIIKRDGSVGPVEILRGVDSRLDDELVRVLKSMPLWTPAQMEGMMVNSRYRIPVRLKLQDNH